MKWIVFLSFFSLLTVGFVSAQSVGIDSTTTAVDSKMEVYIKENIPFKSPIPRPPVREADVLWEVTVWRTVDLRQTQNQSLFFPISPKKIGSRVNFFTLLLEGVERGEITAYDPIPASDEFAQTQIRTYEQIISNGSLLGEAQEVNETSLATGRDTIIIIPGFNALEERECVRLVIKEKVYFNSRHSVLQTEVIGIQPWFIFDRVVDGESRTSTVPIMWIYYPEARPLLARHPVFNPFNDAQNISYDDFFIQHRYDGGITRRSNIQGNRLISDYAPGVRALYEAQRIENEIFNWEQDLWEY